MLRVNNRLPSTRKDGAGGGMASSSGSKVKEVQQQVDDVKAVMCAAALTIATTSAYGLPA